MHIWCECSRPSDSVLPLNSWLGFVREVLFRACNWWIWPGSVCPSVCLSPQVALSLLRDVNTVLMQQLKEEKKKLKGTVFLF